MGDVRIIAQLSIVMKQEEGKPPYVEVSAPADDALCGMMIWSGVKLITKQLEDRRVSIEQRLPSNGGLLAG